MGGSQKTAKLSGLLGPDAVHLLTDVVVYHRIAVFQGEVFQLVFDGVESQTVGERCVDIGGLRGNLELFVRRHGTKGAHVVKTVGKLDEHHTNILVERADDLFEVLGLEALGIVGLVEFGQPIDDDGHLVAKFLTDVVKGELGVLHNVVQQGTNNGSASQSDVLGSDGSHRDGMVDVRFSRTTSLFAVGIGGEVKSFLHHRQVLGLFARLPNSQQTLISSQDLFLFFFLVIIG